MLIRNCAATALLMAFAVVGCGSEDEGGGGGDADGAAAKAACEVYCDATASCLDFAYLDVAECKSDECSMLDQTSGACAGTMKNYYECVNVKTDKCDEIGCEPDYNLCL